MESTYQYLANILQCFHNRQRIHHLAFHVSVPSKQNRKQLILGLLSHKIQFVVNVHAHKD